MKDQFVSNFDVKKYGFNFFTIVSFSIVTILSGLLYSIMYTLMFKMDFSSAIKSNLSAEAAMSFCLSLLLFVLVIHFLKRDILLPLAYLLATLMLIFILKLYRYSFDPFISKDMTFFEFYLSGIPFNIFHRTEYILWKIK